MRISTRLHLAAFLPAAALLLIGFAFVAGTSVLSRMQTEDELLDRARNANFELTILVQEYLLYASPRMVRQLQTRYVSMGGDLDRLGSIYREDALLPMIVSDFQAIGELLNVLLGSENPGANPVAGTLLVKFQDLAGKIRQLDDQHEVLMASFEKQLLVGLIAVVAFLALAVAALLLFLIRRLRLGIDRLKAGAEQVGSGVFEYAVSVDADDELDLLTRSFNEMGRRLKESHAQLQQAMSEQNVILGNLGAGVLFLKDRKILWLNPFMTSTFGYAPEELLGQDTEILYPDRQSYLQIGEEAYLALESGRVHKTEVWMRRKDGELRWCSLTGQAVEPADPAAGSIWIVEDITVRKQMEAELIKAKNLESLGILAGGIAHDFNNLFQGLLGNISLAKMMIPESSEAHRFLTEAEAAYAQGAKLTSQLIAFSSGGGGGRKICRLGPLIQETVLSQVGNSGYTLDFQLAEDLWHAKVAESQIEQVVRHLTMNAMEAMPEGGKLKIVAGNVRLDGEQPPTVPPGNYLKISFEDQGCGIAPENLARIFDPYFSTKPLGSHKGVGLGLSLSETIIKKHGGAITVETEPGMGATFSFYLPAVDADEKD